MRFHSITKHINVGYHFVQTVFKDRQVQLPKFHTSVNPTYILTKPVTEEKFNRCKTALGLEATS